MEEFNNYLLKKFGKSVWELSSSGFENRVLDYDFQMISWDDVGKFFQNNNNYGFDDRFSTADGMLLLNKNNKKQVFFLSLKILIILI